MSSLFKILLIDDDTNFAAHFEMHAKLSGWKAEVLSGESIDSLRETLKSLEPNLIVLDKTLSSDTHINDWLDILSEEKCIDRVVVATGDEDTKEEYESRGYAILDLYEKPIHLERLPFAVRETTTPATINIDELAKQLQPAISIHHFPNSTLSYVEPIWTNTAYDNNPIKHEVEKRSLQLLVLELNSDENKHQAHREDWSEHNKSWQHSRLFKLPNNLYWFVREFRKENILPSFFSTDKELPEFLADVANQLRLWGVTRLRFYKAFDSYNHIGKIEKDYLLIPHYQKGDGFSQGRTESDWKESATAASEKEDTHSIFNLSEGRWFIKTAKHSPPNAGDCELIGWGETLTDRIMIPIKSEGKDRALGLLTFDRRSDHLKNDDGSFKEEIAWLRTYDLAGGASINTISDEELGLMQGFLKAVAGEITTRREHERSTQIRLWHEAISDAIQAALSDAPKRDAKSSMPKQVIKQLLQYLISEWDEIDRQPTQRPPHQDHKSAALIDWYFIREEKSGILRGLGGYGKMASLRENVFFRNVAPFSLALDDKHRKKNFIIQDFPTWLENNPQHFGNIRELKHDFKDHVEKNIRSWVGIPIDLLENRYLMVVCSSQKNYFSTHRTKLLKSAAIRIKPFLLWLVAEKSKGWFSQSLRHELKAPLDYAKLHIETMNGKGEAPDSIKLKNLLQFLQSLIENTHYTSDPDSFKAQAGKTHNTTLDSVWDFIKIAESSEESVQVKVDCSECDKNRSLTPPGKLLKQVLFNLLHNAIKFSPDHFAFKENKFRKMPIQLTVEKTDNNLICKITNYIRESQIMNSNQRMWIFEEDYRVPNDSATATGAGIGLSVVWNICTQTGMKCNALEAVKDKSSEFWQQTFELHIPIQESKHD